MQRELVLACPSQIGDTLMATPAIRSWKRAYPAGRITVSCEDAGGPYQVLLHNPHVDALRVADIDDRAAPVRGTRVRLDAEGAFKWAHLNGKSLVQGYGRMFGVEIDDPRYDYTITADDQLPVPPSRLPQGEQVCRQRLLARLRARLDRTRLRSGRRGQPRRIG